MPRDLSVIPASEPESPYKQTGVPSGAPVFLAQIFGIMRIYDFNSIKS